MRSTTSEHGRAEIRRREERRRRASEAGAWIGLLAPPLAWLGAQSLSYALVPWVCHGGPKTVLHAVTLVALAVAVAGGLCAWRSVSEGGGGGADEGSARRLRFVAMVGLFTSGVFFLVLLAQEIANSMLEPCLA